MTPYTGWNFRSISPDLGFTTMLDDITDTEKPAPDRRWFDRLTTFLAWMTVIVVLFLPLVALVFLRTVLETLQLYDTTGLRVSGSAVGIGVILRATARRLLRAGARNVMRTTVGTFTRTTMRALTRRVVRIAIRSASLVAQKVFLVKTIEYAQTTETQETAPTTQQPETTPSPESGQTAEAKQIHSPTNSVLAVVLGFVALFCSLLGILYILSWNDTPVNEYHPHISITLATNPMVPLSAVPVATPEMKVVPKYEQVSTGLTQDKAAMAQRNPEAFPSYSIFLLAFLGAVPLLFYALFITLAAKRNQTTVQFQTGIDGLLLQAYFTGGGSFLPLTTDVHYEGTTKKQAMVGATALVGLFIIHVLLLFPAYLLNSYLYWYASGMFLLYCFIYAFPIRPLDGHALWSWSWWLWFLFFLPIFVSFMLNIPGSFHAIL